MQQYNQQKYFSKKANVVQVHYVSGLFKNNNNNKILLSLKLSLKEN